MKNDTGVNISMYYRTLSQNLRLHPDNPIAKNSLDIQRKKLPKLCMEAFFSKT